MKSEQRSLDFILRAMRSFWRVFRRGLSGPLLGSKPCSSSHLWPWKKPVHTVATKPSMTHCLLTAISQISSPPAPSLFLTAPAALGPLLFLKCARPTPTSGPLDVLFPVWHVFFPRPPHVHMGVRFLQAHRAPCLEGPCACFNVLPLSS